jgi:hypothetical protein
MLKTLLRHTLIKNIFDIFVDFLIFKHFHYMKIHRLLSSLPFVTAASASFLDLYLEFDDSGQLSTKIYDSPLCPTIYGIVFLSFCCAMML